MIILLILILKGCYFGWYDYKFGAIDSEFRGFCESKVCSYFWSLKFFKGVDTIT